MIDTHAHLISDDLAAYPPAPLSEVLRPGSMDHPMTAERLLCEMDQQGLERAVVVQRAHVYGYDNSYVVDSAKRYSDRLAAVCVVDARLPDAAQSVSHWVAERGACSIRLTEPHRGASTDWFNSAAADAVWRTCTELGASISLQFYQWNRLAGLAAVPAVLRRFPHTRVVIEHLTNFVESVSTPDHGIDPPVTELVDYPQVAFKVTTINFARMQKNAVPPQLVLRKLVDLFGAPRLMWGSDVAQSPQSYGEMTALVRGALISLDATEQKWILERSAARFYAPAGKVGGTGSLKP